MEICDLPHPSGTLLCFDEILRGDSFYQIDEESEGLYSKMIGPHGLRPGSTVELRINRGDGATYPFESYIFIGVLVEEGTLPVPADPKWHHRVWLLVTDQNDHYHPMIVHFCSLERSSSSSSSAPYLLADECRGALATTLRKRCYELISQEEVKIFDEGPRGDTTARGSFGGPTGRSHEGRSAAAGSMKAKRKAAMDEINMSSLYYRLGWRRMRWGLRLCSSRRRY